MAKKKSTTKGAHLDKERLAAMIEKATVDAYGDEEQATSWFTMFEEHLALPFETRYLGRVERVAGRQRRHLASLCLIMAEAISSSRT